MPATAWETLEELYIGWPNHGVHIQVSQSGKYSRWVRVSPDGSILEKSRVFSDSRECEKDAFPIARAVAYKQYEAEVAKEALKQFRQNLKNFDET